MPHEDGERLVRRLAGVVDADGIESRDQRALLTVDVHAVAPGAIGGPAAIGDASLPFGGVGASGYGRFGGKAGIDSFTELRWITIETQPGHFPI